MKRIYVGPKQATIENSDFFDASITLFGDNTNNNKSYQSNTLENIMAFEYWNPDNNFKEIEIYNREIAKLVEPVEIMAHDPKVVQGCKFPENVKMICRNSQLLLAIFNDKIQTRELLKNIVPMLNYYTIKGKEFDYQQLCKISDQLVVQLPIGGGGSKTFLCNKNNSEDVKARLLPNELYSISAYERDNIPYNIHCLISETQIEIFPPSKQELEIVDKIEYIGSDYNIEISNLVKEKFIKYSTAICEKLQTMGYRGVLGIDYIYVNNELYFIEINPRFQGSTRQLDELLKASGLPSIFEYNYLAFEGEKMPDTKNMKFTIFEK